MRSCIASTRLVRPAVASVARRAAPRRSAPLVGGVVVIGGRRSWAWPQYRRRTARAAPRAAWRRRCARCRSRRSGRPARRRRRPRASARSVSPSVSTTTRAQPRRARQHAQFVPAAAVVRLEAAQVHQHHVAARPPARPAPAARCCRGNSTSLMRWRPSASGARSKAARRAFTSRRVADEALGEPAVDEAEDVARRRACARPGRCRRSARCCRSGASARPPRRTAPAPARRAGTRAAPAASAAGRSARRSAPAASITSGIHASGSSISAPPRPMSPAAPSARISSTMPHTAVNSTISSRQPLARVGCGQRAAEPLRRPPGEQPGRSHEEQHHRVGAQPAGQGQQPGAALLR